MRLSYLHVKDNFYITKTILIFLFVFQVDADGLTFVAVFIVAALLGGVLVQYSHNGGLVGNLKACRSRTIMFTFMLLLLLYVMCYTTIWVHIMDLKRIYPWRQKIM